MKLKIKKVSANEWQIIDGAEKAPWTTSFKSYAAAKRVLDKTEECIARNNAWMN